MLLKYSSDIDHSLELDTICAAEELASANSLGQDDKFKGQTRLLLDVSERSVALH